MRWAVIAALGLAGCAQPYPASPPPGTPPSLQLVPASYYSTYYVPVRKRGKVVRFEKRTVRVMAQPDQPPEAEAEDGDSKKRRETLQWYADHLAGELEKLRKDLGKAP